MQRRKKGNLTVERWALPRGRVVFEVSIKGADTAADLQAFRDTIVTPLLQAATVPINASKTELGSHC